MKTYAEMKAAFDQIRDDAMAFIKEYMEAHAGKVADFVENSYSYVPVVFDCATCDEEVATCDQIYMEDGHVYVNYSNSYMNSSCELTNVPTGALLDIIDSLDECLFKSDDED